MKKSIFVLFGLAAIFFGVSFFNSSDVIFENGNQSVKEPANIIQSESAVDVQPENELLLIAVGDITLTRKVELKIKENNNDFKFPFLRIADYLKNADLLFGNLESVISDKGKKIGKFRSRPEAVQGLEYAGFDVLSVANNHAFDYGVLAFEDSLLRLKQAGISYAGGGFSEEEARKAVVKEIKGVKIVFLGYVMNFGQNSWKAGENKSGILILNEKIKEDIKKAKQESDLVVVSMHFGEEFQALQNKQQENYSKMAIDSGADLIIGHHPHVIQPLEKYKDGWIAYSLGNFIFDQDFSKKTMKAGILEVKIKNKKIETAQLKTAEISLDFQPFIP